MNERIEKIKNHVKEKKIVYITGATCLVVGVLGGALYAYGGVQFIENFKVIQIGSNNTVLADLSRRGHPGWTIVCNETGVPFPSQNYAAKCMNLDPAALSHHLDGTRDQVDGFTFTRIRETQ